MSQRLAAFAVLAIFLSTGLAMGLASALAASPGPEPDYTVERPQGYRRWTHVMSYVIGPQAPGAARNGGLHNFYANEKAVEGYRTGRYPDGAVLIDERNNAVEDGGVTRTGDLLHIAVMVKDSKRYASTSGWGFEVFQGDAANGIQNAQLRAGCHSCHLKQKEQDLVFTHLRP